MPRRLLPLPCCWLFLLALIAPSAPAASALREVATNLWVWTDTCNVYVLRDGDAAILIDLGDASVLEQLPSLGITRVEWVLFTHHHREQCQGATRLPERGVRTAAPEAERELFTTPEKFRRMNVRLGDPYTIHGASFVRPSVTPIPIDLALTNGAVFRWRNYELHCVATPGNSPGALSYLLRSPERLLAFSGDLMLKNAGMHTWFDSEWDYGFGGGIQALRKSVATIQELKPDLLCPAHGPLIPQPVGELAAYAARLAHLEKLYLRGYGVEAQSNAYQDRVSTPTLVTNVTRVSPHLFKFKRENFWPNFNLILAENGRALIVDCGLLDEAFLQASLEGLQTYYGLKGIDAVIVTHMHGDHLLEAPFLQQKWGAEIWALDRMAPVCEHPEWFDYAAPIQAYGKKGVERVKFDRLFKSGESFDWEGYRFTVDWMPGQTEFALCLHGQIDGRKVAFTGDNIFGDPQDESQTGHEAVVAHNSAILEEGYIYAGEYLTKLQPDIMVGGHSFVMDRPKAFIERYRRWAYEMRDAFQSLCPDGDYRFWFDPYWVRAEPYRLQVRAGETVSFRLHLRNFLPRDRNYRVALALPQGFAAEPPVLEVTLKPEERRHWPIQLRAPVGAKPGTRIVAFDLTADGQRLGQLFDVIVSVAQ